MKKIIILLVLVPAMCFGQRELDISNGNIVHTPKGLVKFSKEAKIATEGYTRYYSPWGSSYICYIGELGYDSSLVRPKIDIEAEAYWSEIFKADLTWGVPLIYSIGDGKVSGIFYGGDSIECQARTDALIYYLKQNPYAEILEIVSRDTLKLYQFPYEQ